MEYAAGEMNIWKNKKFILVLVVGFALRLIFNAVFVNLNNDYYWEFGVIAKNLLHGNGFSFFYADSHGFLQIGFTPGSHPFPSAYMPPGYTFFLYPFLLIKNLIVRNYSILFCHTLIWALTEYFLFKLLRNLFSVRIALAAIWIYALIPEFIYANTTYGTAQFYHLFAAVAFYLFYKFDDNPNFKNAFLIGLTFGVFFLFRSEHIILLGIYSIYQLFKKRFKYILFINLIVLALMMPWTIRNYMVFDRLVTGSTSAGYNFYRGHNPYCPSMLYNHEVDSLIKQLPQNDMMEIEMNDLYYNLAFKEIREDPVLEIRNFGIKLIDLWIAFWRPSSAETYNYTFNYTNGFDKRSLNPAYYIPWFLMLGLAIFYVKNNYNKVRDRYFLMFLMYHTLLALIFFAIPRYQTMMKIALIPYAAGGAIILWDRFMRRFRKS